MGELSGRVGVNVRRPRPSEALAAIRQAEEAGVGTIWMTMSATGPDTLTTFAAAAMRSERVVLGTSIVPAFTRHPLGLAGQALALADLAPGRVRIGIGTSHGPTMAAYGARPEDDLRARPLSWLREYLTVARTALREGAVRFSGRSFQVDATLAGRADLPLLISALRPHAWELAGELSDGGISWLCPTDYLLREALPAIVRGAERAGRPRPPLVAHIPVALSTDRARVRAAARQSFGGYAPLPFYAKMFAASGYPLGPNREYSDALLDHLVISGDDDAVARQLRQLLADGLDELLVMPLAIDDGPAEEARLLRVIGE